MIAAVFGFRKGRILSIRAEKKDKRKFVSDAIGHTYPHSKYRHFLPLAGHDNIYVSPKTGQREMVHVIACQGMRGGMVRWEACENCVTPALWLEWVLQL